MHQSESRRVGKVPRNGHVVATVLALLLAPQGHAADRPGGIAITTPNAPKAIGPYVQAVVVGDTVYLAGQLPVDPATGKLLAGDIRAQTRQVLRNLQAVLAANRMSLEDAVMATVYMTDLTQFAAMNETYAEFFEAPPARATVEVKGLALGASIEISLVAQVRGRR